MKASVIVSVLGALLVGAAGLTDATKCRRRDSNTSAALNGEGRTLQGLNYNSKRASGECGTVEDVKADLEYFSVVTKAYRIYSLTNCNEGEMLLQAIKGTDFKVALGMWVGKDPAPVAKEMAKLEALAQTYGDVIKSSVSGLIVGSEALYRKDVDEATLTGYIKQARDILRKHDLDTPVTAAETYDKQTPGLVDAVDYVTMNAFPFWENKTIEEAKSVFFEHYDSVSGLARGKTVVVGETGWPTAGENYGPAEPSLENMKTYLNQFACEAHKRNIKYYWFSCTDEPWKHDEHSIGVEPNWGLTQSDRRTWKIDGAFYQC
ncbi:glycoside hydrolase 3 protein [Dimargaris xerosporica]|nr:glycoside hydrolase 3 protein [Dimargaris xerosporica]